VEHISCQEGQFDPVLIFRAAPLQAHREYFVDEDLYFARRGDIHWRRLRRIKILSCSFPLNAFSSFAEILLPVVRTAGGDVECYLKRFVQRVDKSFPGLPAGGCHGPSTPCDQEQSPHAFSGSADLEEDSHGRPHPDYGAASLRSGCR
jgi:hypothetical protein